MCVTIPPTLVPLLSSFPSVQIPLSMRSLLKTLLYKAGFSIKKIRHAPRRCAAASSAQSADADIMSLLHQTNPYEDFDFKALPFDAHGWGGQSPAFRELITQLKPRLILEVGTWKGASALEMAAALRDAGQIGRAHV